MKRKFCLLFSFIFSLVFCVSGSEHLTTDSVFAASPASAPQEKSLIPGGKCVGVTLSTNGVLVTDISDIVTENGKHLSPAKDAGIKPGDLIKSFNNQETLTVSQLNSAIRSSKGKSSKLKLVRNGCEREVLITPQLSQTDKNFKIGAWVKDAASGIGTVTFYDPETKTFAALGHGICDSETGEIFNIDTGNIFSSSIVSVNKGEKGIPGELCGIFEEDGPVLGEITNNELSGIFGTTQENFLKNVNRVPIMKRKDVSLGKAYIFSNIEGNKVEKFDIEILRIMPNKLSPQKGMVIKITDQNLINKTGGIVRGMSGSPILQNGKIVGAVTHVFVNDPTRGYGIFIEDMMTF
ncbi:MAG: SpoIVB peptidase [Clostridia bacterium]|nr:SpoIVB peptidase [Clostridia bacterium]